MATNKDFGKGVSDFLTKGFPVNPKVTFETNSNPLKVTTESEQKGGAISTSVTPVWTVNSTTELKGEFKSSGDLATTLTLKYPAGLKTALTYSFGNKANLVAAFDYTYSRGTLSSKFTFPAGVIGCPTLELGGVFKKDQIGVGAVLNVKPESSELDNATLNFEYTAPKQVFTASGTFSGKGKHSGVVRYLHTLNPTTTFAAQLEFSDQHNAAFGLSRKLDDSSKGKVVVRSSGIVALGYEKALSSSTTLTVGTELDAFEQTHKSGFSVSFKN